MINSGIMSKENFKTNPSSSDIGTSKRVYPDYDIDTSNGTRKTTIDGCTVIEYERKNIYIIEDIMGDKFCNKFIHLIDTLPLNKFDHAPGNNVRCYLSQFSSLSETSDEFYYSFPTETIEYNKSLDRLNKNLPVSTNKMNGYLKREIDLYKEDINGIMNSVEKVMEKINPKIVFSYNSGYTLRKIYGSTRTHSDGLIEVLDSNITYIKKQKLGDYRMIRNSSIIFALNDDYIGGTFRFPYQDVSLKLKKGSILIFPPYWTHPHECDELENNTYRYTINTWSCEKL